MVAHDTVRSDRNALARAASRPLLSITTSLTARAIDFRYAPADGWTLICRPDDAFKSLVREDGALLYGFDGRVVDVCQFHTVLELSAETALRPLAIEQRTESARRPIVRTLVRYPNQTLELVAFGHDDRGRRTDVVLWTITAAEDADELLASLRVEAHLRGRALAAAPGDGPPHELYAVPVDAALTLPAEGTDGIPRTTAAAPGATCVLRSVPQPLMETHADGFRPVSAAIAAPELLRRGESASGAIVVPLNHGETAELDLAWARRALDQERRHWDALELMPHALEVPDPDLQDLLIACSRNILQAREREDGLPILHVGPTIYRGLWLVDGHFLLEAARYLGFDEAAEAGLDVLLRRVRSDGSIVQIEGLPHIKETGIAIATLVRQRELSGDLDGLRRDWPVVRAAVAHVEELRRRARELPTDHPLHGVLPDAFGDGGLAGCRPEYTTVAWTLIGLRHAARGAELIGEAADARRFAADYEALRRDFERSAAAQRRPVPDGEGHYLPMCPPASGPHQFVVGASPEEVPRWRAIQPETATWALCHAIWPGEVFAPEDRLVQDLLALFECRDDEQGIPATTGWLPLPLGVDVRSVVRRPRLALRGPPRQGRRLPLRVRQPRLPNPRLARGAVAARGRESSRLRRHAAQLGGRGADPARPSPARARARRSDRAARGRARGVAAPRLRDPRRAHADALRTAVAARRSG